MIDYFVLLMCVTGFVSWLALPFYYMHLLYEYKLKVWQFSVLLIVWISLSFSTVIYFKDAINDLA